MTAYEITHTHDGGTILEDSSRGDGAPEILFKVSRRWRTHPEVGVYVRGSRDHDADRTLIAASAAALEAAGNTVTVSIDNTPRPAAARRADAATRATEKAAGLAAAAGKAARTAGARRDAAREISAGWEPGQPILRGHHSERGHRRAVERMQAHDEASWDAAKRAESLTQAAEAVEAHAARRDDPLVMTRRIETLRANVRRCEREQPGATGGRAEDLARWIAQDTEEIDHLSGVLAGLAEAGEFVAWTRNDFQRGDQVYASPGVWVPVLRVNAKSVTVPWIIMAMDRRETEHTERVTFDKIGGRRRDGVQLDAPNGTPRTLAPAAPAADAAGDVHRAHAVTSGPFCVAYDNHTDAPAGVRSTFVRADVTCPACLATFEPGGDDPGSLQRAADGRARARRVEMAAAKLAAETYRAEPPVSICPNDETIGAMLAGCVKPPAADLYPEIRAAYLAGLAEWQREHAPQPNTVRIERHRPSVTQGEVSVWYGGELVGRFGDDIRLCESGSNGRDPHNHGDGSNCFGGFYGLPDRRWEMLAAEWDSARQPAGATVTVYGIRAGQPDEMLSRYTVTLETDTDDEAQSYADEIAAHQPYRPGEGIRVLVGRDNEPHTYSTAERAPQTAAEILGEPDGDQVDTFVSGWAALSGA